jgi:hypothetical protein
MYVSTNESMKVEDSERYQQRDEKILSSAASSELKILADGSCYSVCSS